MDCSLPGSSVHGILQAREPRKKGREERKKREVEVWGDKEGVWDREGRKAEERRRERGKEREGVLEA